MKKLMKKKVSLLGKEFSVLALVAFMMIGFASAALVPYLSNVVSGATTIASPLVLTGMDIELEIHGGDILTETLNVANLADTEISYYTGFTVTGPANSVWTEEVEEFDSFTVSGFTVPMGDVCTSVDNILTCVLGEDALVGGDNKDYEVVASFNAAIIPGAYTLTARIFTTSTIPSEFDFTTP